MSIDLRPARASDVDALAAIEQAVFPGDRIARTSFRRLVKSASSMVFAAAEGESVVGYCAVLFRAGSRIARLYSIAVAPGRAGIGRRLLAVAEDAARQRGASEMRLEVRADNRRAVALYERNGYAPFDRRAGYYADGEAAIRFRKLFASRARPLAPPGRPETPSG